VGSGKCRGAHVSLPLLPEQLANVACHLASLRTQKAFHSCGSVSGAPELWHGEMRGRRAGKKRPWQWKAPPPAFQFLKGRLEATLDE
jgi:hypothetical protein